jgi:hydrogenase maturation protease
MAETAQVKPLLLIGCGNELRGDDGLGPEIVRALQTDLAATSIPLQVMSFQQLDVILAETLAEARAAIFVDARDDGDDRPVRTRRVRPASQPIVLHHTTHVTSVESLLRMARDWYGYAPPTFAVLPKGYNFELGTGISFSGRIAESLAKRAVRSLLRRLDGPI